MTILLPTATSITPGSSYSNYVHGQDFDWLWWVPAAWQAVADPEGTHPAPPIPVSMGGDESQVRTLGQGGYHIAWWGPFLHLTMFGLGWNRADLGIQRWITMGRPVDDPILALVRRWWGQKDGFLGDFLTWARKSYSFGRLIDGAAQALRTQVVISVPDERPESDARWFGSSDEMHTVHHMLLALQPSERIEPVIVRRNTQAANTSPRAVLLLDDYLGWPTRLADLKLPKSGSGRNWRVDVVCKPLGWLGEYRLSAQTGRWFRGRHKWHLLGN